MNRFVAALGAFLLLPLALSGVTRAATTGHPQAALAAACGAAIAAAVIGWVLAQVSLAMRTLHAPRDRWMSRDGGHWR